MSLPADQRTRSCATELVCPDCGTRVQLLDTTFRCPDCDKGLDVVYDYELARHRIAEHGPE
jgi:Zn finger protein HypA/HybF involved in hydrogenase expression